jgi:hypothetical protein
MFDPMLSSYPEEVISEYQRRLQEADQARLAALVGAQRVTLTQRLALWLGNAFISIGMGLKRRYHAQQRWTYLSGPSTESRMEY